MILNILKLSTPRRASGAMSLVCHGNSVLHNMAMDICGLLNSLNLTKGLFNDEFHRALYLTETIPGCFPIETTERNGTFTRSPLIGTHKTLTCTHAECPWPWVARETWRGRRGTWRPALGHPHGDDTCAAEPRWQQRTDQSTGRSHSVSPVPTAPRDCREKG